MAARMAAPIRGYREVDREQPPVLARVVIRRTVRGKGRSCRPAVVMVQPDQHRDGHDRAGRAIGRRWSRGAGDSLPDALVWPRGVGIRHVGPQDVSQLSLAEDEEMVEAPPPHAAQEALAGRVRPRCADRRRRHRRAIRSRAWSTQGGAGGVHAARAARAAESTSR